MIITVDLELVEGRPFHCQYNSCLIVAGESASRLVVYILRCDGLSDRKAFCPTLIHCVDASVSPEHVDEDDGALSIHPMKFGIGTKQKLVTRQSNNQWYCGGGGRVLAQVVPKMLLISSYRLPSPS
ncbi:hypothetical protein CY34DRAFT_468047 [Suillus luteus UH-Slu-Lm8-n1]|uniref:Uncharacterized protein n=1 Tax=Suillus luteus UH-Slu-Lm8-n1 TaxID=930992 RepID=A0A0D0AGI2_9AGAM|nr:hypothetical protein CY34DRAFT_468047 [Suillus luteus UH-Slu-Lm8-n1]